jgi:hypothetical protein
MEQALLDMLVQAIPAVSTVLQVLGGLVVIATAVVKLTPSKDDDEKLAKVMAIPLVGGIIAALAVRAPIQPK